MNSSRNHSSSIKTPHLIPSLQQAALTGDLNAVIARKNANETHFKKDLLTPNLDFNLPLDRAAARGHYEIVKILVETHSEPGCAYHISNPQNYSPFLSAVRWYCKVLEGSYNKGNYHGKFNTGPNKNQDYLNIITLLCDSYPAHMKLADNKDLGALHYVIFHLDVAVSKPNNDANIAALKELIKLLLEKGMSLESNNSIVSPRRLAKERGLLPAVEEIEKSVKRSSITTTTIPITQPALNQKALVKPIKKQSISSNEFTYEVVYQLNPIYNSFKTNEKLSVQEQQQEKIKNKKTNKPKQPILNHFTKKEPILDCLGFAQAIFSKFKTLNKYQAFTPKQQNEDNHILAELKRLIGESSEAIQPIKDSKKDKLVTTLAATIKIQRETTGFLCCKKTKCWLNLDEGAFRAMLQAPKDLSKPIL